VVARTDLQLGAQLTADEVTVVEVPEQGYPQGGFQSIEDVVDRSVTQAILSNEPVTAARVTEKGVGFGLASTIPAGYRAVAIAINQVSGVSGFILPGSHVDILLSAMPSGGGERLTTTVLENVTVVSTGHRQQPNANGQPENVPVMNMLLTPEDAELLTLATQEGRIQLVLRNPKDVETTAQERAAKTSRDLFRKILPETPAPRQMTAAAPRPRPEPVIVMEPLPPPIYQIEMIRGNKRSVEEIERAAEN
jgi:pilus assembly protein CpaB